MKKCLLSLILMSTCAFVFAAEFSFPDGIGKPREPRLFTYANVKESFGAKGDGKTDDTHAFKKALAQFTETNLGKVIFIPRGTYLISDTIYAKIREGNKTWACRVYFIGENRNDTVLKLKDNCPGYTDAKSPKAMIFTGSVKPRGKGGEGNTAFGNTVRNLTLDVGQGNPGAVGVDYLVSNYGSIRDVTFKAPEGSGYCAIKMDRNWPGPGLIKNVSIDGFDYGIRISTHQYSMTFDNIVFNQQKVMAIRNHGNQMYMRRITSNNTVPFYSGETKKSDLLLMDSELKGGADAAAMIRQGESRVYAINVKGPGMDTFKNPAQPLELFPSPPKTMGLTVREIPEPTPLSRGDHDQWAHAESFGATPSGGERDTVALQKAIDSGKRVLYLPSGKYHLDNPVIIRGNVEKIIGFGANLVVPKGEAYPAMILENTNHKLLEIEGLRCSTGQWGKRSVKSRLTKTEIVFRNCTLTYENAVENMADMFFEDCIVGGLTLNHPQNVWGVQYNTEFNRPLITNKGGKIWLFGVKTEIGEGKGKNKFKGHRNVLTNLGGDTEILGWHILYTNKVLPKSWTDIGPMLINDRGGVSVTMLRYHGKTYPVGIRERRGDEWKERPLGTVSLYRGFEE